MKLPNTTFFGPGDLLHEEKAAIFNSRQSKYPVGEDSWIRSTVRAVEYIKDRDFTVITSLGMKTWEMVLSLAIHHGVKTIIVVPAGRHKCQSIIQDVINRFKIGAGMAGFIFSNELKEGDSKANWPDRDRQIASLADTIFPVSIRSHGNLESLLEHNRAKVRDDFVIPYEKKVRHRPQYDNFQSHPSLDEGEYLVHFTRSAASPWPGETDYDFYMAILNSGNEYCRSARFALMNILKTQKIYASSKNIRDGFRVVGFTELVPESLLGLFRYRARLVNPNFEPYGLGLTISVAGKANIRPVRYDSPDFYSTLAPEDKPFFQSAGKSGRWRGEKEWRHWGDFDYSDIPKNRLRVFVKNYDDVEFFKKRTNLRVSPLLTN